MKKESVHLRPSSLLQSAKSGQRLLFQKEKKATVYSRLATILRQLRSGQISASRTRRRRVTTCGYPHYDGHLEVD